jgi:prolyl oligopeptidase
MIKKCFKLTFAFLLSIALTIFNSCQTGNSINNNNLKYPVLKSSPVVDTYFGKQVTDDYRILEETNNKEVKEWLQNEKKLCDSVLSTIPNRANLKKEIEDLTYASNFRGGLPRAAGSKIFFLRNYLKEGIQKIFYMDSIDTNEIELFSTGSMNNDKHSFNVDYFHPSYDGKYLALGISSDGDENSVIYIIDVKKKLILADRIERAMGGNPNWLIGKSAFFYQQFKETGKGDDEQTKYENTKVKLHFIGTDSKNDKEIFSKIHNPDLPIDKIDFTLIYTFPSSDKVLAVLNHGSQPYASLYYSSIDDVLSHLDRGRIAWKKICGFEEKVTNYALNGNDLYLLRYDSETNGILEKRNLQKETKAEIILKGQSEILNDMIETENALYIKSVRNGISKLIKVNLDNLEIKDIKLPYLGSLDIKHDWEVPPMYIHSKDLFIGLSSWSKEWTVYHYNNTTEELTKTDLRPQSIYSDNSDLIVKEVEVLSPDGAMVPLSIIYSKNTLLNGQNPTLLYGYGAYGISMNSFFDPSLLAWFHKGGIYAIAHVRGGGEKGDAWYKGGYKATKPNSWKDFIVCAEYLIKNNYTSSPKLAAYGGSAGSITVGRAITERPDLFKAAIISVGVPDMIRFETSSNTINISEFGTVKDSLEFQYLYEMDTYRHIKKGIHYPSILFTAGMNDARVNVWEPAKAVAAFQGACAGQNNIILFRISDNGHFGDDDFAKESSDIYSFLLWQLGHRDFQK